MIVSLAEDGQPPGQELFGSMASELVWHKDVGGFSMEDGGSGLTNHYLHVDRRRAQLSGGFAT